jgi:hypothetical protein
VAPSELCEAIDRCYRGLGVGPFEQLEIVPLETTSPEPPTDSAADQEVLEFGDEDELAFVDEIPAAETAAQVPAPESPNAGATSKVEASNRVILRALTQILIEKDLVGRDEFYARVRQLQDEEESS